MKQVSGIERLCGHDGIHFCNQKPWALVVLLLTISVVFPTVSFSQQEAGTVSCDVPPGRFIVDTKSNCAAWFDKRNRRMSFSWTGKCENGRIGGPGVLQWFFKGKPFEHYEGETLDGKMNGTGNIKWKSGQAYSGTFRDGKPHGTGRYEYGDGENYVGDFACGQKTGAGVHEYSAGIRYEGEFLDGQWHGTGLLTTKRPPMSYLGEFRRGGMHGKGRFRSPDYSYEGEWKDNKKHGLGKWTSADGDLYEGEFSLGEASGRGVYITHHGHRYEGEFSIGRKHGAGKCSSPGITPAECRFEYGKQIK